MEDLELDADAGQGSLSTTPQVVRKAINLNLKKPKFKAKSSTKSTKKKERRDFKDDEPSKGMRRNKGNEKKHDNTDEDDREDEELDWSHQIMFCGEKVQNPMIHICEKCLLPILIYGRLSPCKHVFCLSCAEKSNGTCARCESIVERIEPAGIGHIFVCSFGGSRNGVSGCRRSYVSQRDLIAHIKHRHEEEGSNLQELELLRPQQTGRVPFLQTQQGLIVHPLQNSNQPPSLGNAVVIAGLQANNQQPIFVDANRMPLIAASTQGQFQSLSQGMALTQTQFPNTAYIQQSRTQYQAMGNQIPSTGNLQSSQHSSSRPPDIQSQTSSASDVRLGSAQVHPPNDWRTGSIPSSGQEWGQQQNRNTNYQQQFYK